MADDTTTSSNDTEPQEDADAGATGIETSSASGGADDASDRLGEAGKSALAKERKRAAEAERALREARRQARSNAAAAAELAELKKAQQTDQERLQAALDQAAERNQALAMRAVKAEIRSLAAGFEDPTDAEVHLDLSAYLDEDGDIDTEQIKADLADLLERKPHLAKKAPVPEPEKKRPAPDLTQASGANKQHKSSPEDEFAGFLRAKLARGR